MPASFTNSDSDSSVPSLTDFADVDLSRTNVTRSANGQDEKQVRLRLSLDEICHRTNFTRQEVRAFYRTLKQVKFHSIFYWRALSCVIYK